MDNLPLDMSHPSVRDHMALVRLQVLTPLSLLINIAAVALCATIANPSIRDILRVRPTSISPSPTVLAIYVAVIYATQIGYCLLLVLASKPETKRTLTKGVGLSLVFANWIMALWAAAWILQFFLISAVLQGLLIICLLYSNIALLVYHSPTNDRPIDTALIHAPLRFFLVLPLNILFPLCLFITLGLAYHPTPGGQPTDYSKWHAWAGFAVIMATNLVGLVVIALRRDIVWCIAATWICVSIWTDGVKPAPVYITTLTFTVLLPIALLASYVYAHFYGPRPIALNGDDALNRNRATPQRAVSGDAREVDVEALWG
ncbi:hypothetical protein BDZ94DRAFT_1259567 [Collybia nuda]|uniref:Uncharacterized protein n=1 Tax=Collybia nuda TaxID=64659 RepID=A0A9P6CES1_9AGAR|nr:hypothetical protein BDZ94DRAFT_1259567 [Collybia nuda]